MGGKHTWARKHIPVYLAGVILLGISACAPVSALFTSRENTAPPLSHTQSLMSQGDFEGALKKSQEIFSLAPKSPPGDAALFDIGLIYAHYANPKRDYTKSLVFFTRVVREFPRSPLVEEAKVWIGVLESIEKAKQVDLEIEVKKKGLIK